MKACSTRKKLNFQKNKGITISKKYLHHKYKKVVYDKESDSEPELEQEEEEEFENEEAEKEPEIKKAKVKKRETSGNNIFD